MCGQFEIFVPKEKPGGLAVCAKKKDIHFHCIFRQIDDVMTLSSADLIA